MSDDKKYNVVNDVSSIKIEPGETVGVRFDFEQYESMKYDESYIEIDYKGINGDTFTLRFDIGFHEYFY